MSDPALDALIARAEPYGANPDTWWFLTGNEERAEEYGCSYRGFRIKVEPQLPLGEVYLVSVQKQHGPHEPGWKE